MKILNQKKYFFLRTLFFSMCSVFAASLFATSAEASSIIFKPNVISVQRGDSFTLPVIIDPLNDTQYTVRLSIEFPSDVLKVTSFNFSENWFAVPEPLYDGIDNDHGILIKTAGFPKGFSSPMAFGTITFLAKASGEGAITVGSQSFILNAENTSTLDARPQVHFAAAETLSSKPVSVKSLPDLSVSAKNLFDVSVEGAASKNSHRFLFFAFLFTFAIVFGILGQVISARLRRRSIMRKLTNIQKT